MPKPPEFDNWPASIEPGFGPFRGVIQKVVDGDTLYILLDISFNTYAYHSIRLLGVNAPELFSGPPEERERGAAAKAYLESIAPAGTKCLLRTDKDKTTFGRYIASALLADGTDLGSEMVRAGHATWATY